MAGAAAEKVATGIPGLDAALGGGIGRGSVAVVAGPSGAGKSVMAAQFLHHGAKALREPGLLMIFGEPSGQFFARMEKMGFMLDELREAGSLHSVDYAADEGDRFFTDLPSIADTVAEKKIARIAVDSASSLMMLRGKDEGRKAFVSLLNFLHKSGCACLVTLNADADGNAMKDAAGVAHLADELMAIHAKMEGGERKLYFEVLKAGGAAHERKLMQFRITERGAAVL